MSKQEKYEEAARELAEKERLKAEEKRKEMLEEWENLSAGKGYRNKTKLRGQTDTSAEEPNKSKPKKSTLRSGLLLMIPFDFECHIK